MAQGQERPPAAASEPEHRVKAANTGRWTGRTLERVIILSTYFRMYLARSCNAQAGRGRQGSEAAGPGIAGQRDPAQEQGVVFEWPSSRPSYLPRWS